MRPCTTSIDQFLKDTIDIKYYELDYNVPKSENRYYEKATKEQFDELFNKYYALVYEYPDDMAVYGHRAHKVKCTRYTPNYVRKVFKDAVCNLLTEYKKQKTELRYVY